MSLPAPAPQGTPPPATAPRSQPPAIGPTALPAPLSSGPSPAWQPAGSVPSTTTSSGAPATTGSTSTTQQPAQGSRMPTDLARLRAAAPIACALTGVAASGLLGVSGYQAPAPALVSQQQHLTAARHDFLRADLAAGQLLAQRTVHPDITASQQATTRETYEQALDDAAAQLVAAAGASTPPPELATTIRGMTTYQRQVEQLLAAPASAQTTSSAATHQALRDTAATHVLDPLAQASATTMHLLAEGGGAASRPGGRSLVLVVGGLSTLGLALASWWLARKTHRIINPGLVGATVVTAGITVLALSPPFVRDATTAINTAKDYDTAVTTVYDLRRAELNSLLPAGQALSPATWSTMSKQADDRLQGIRLIPQSTRARMASEAAQDWGRYERAHETLTAPTTSAATKAQQLQTGGDALSALFTAATDASQRTTADLNRAVGTPGLLWSSATLAGGIAAGALAWAGVGRRLREYR